MLPTGKILLVDLDDTIENFCETWVNELNKKYGGNYTLQDVNNWEISNIYPEIPKEEKLELLHHEDFWMKVTPLEGAADYLRLLQEEGFNIFIVTSTDYRNIRYKVEHVLEKHFPFISKHNLITTYCKQLIRGDILVDDYVNNLVGGTYKKILFTAPHNRNTILQEDIIRVHDWRTCYKLIHALTED